MRALRCRRGESRIWESIHISISHSWCQSMTWRSRMWESIYVSRWMWESIHVSHSCCCTCESPDSRLRVCWWEDERENENKAGARELSRHIYIYERRIVDSCLAFAMLYVWELRLSSANVFVIEWERPWAQGREWERRVTNYIFVRVGYDIWQYICMCMYMYVYICIYSMTCICRRVGYDIYMYIYV